MQRIAPCNASEARCMLYFSSSGFQPLCGILEGDSFHVHLTEPNKKIRAISAVHPCRWSHETNSPVLHVSFFTMLRLLMYPNRLQSSRHFLLILTLVLANLVSLASGASATSQPVASPRARACRNHRRQQLRVVSRPPIRPTGQWARSQMSPVGSRASTHRAQTALRSGRWWWTAAAICISAAILRSPVTRPRTMWRDGIEPQRCGRRWAAG